MSPNSFQRRFSPDRPPRRAPGNRLTVFCNRGFTITELLVIVIIVGLLAVVATPAIRSGDPAKLDLAATQVAEAIRLARSESMRTGDAYGITISHVSQRVRVRRYDLSEDPAEPKETMYHPVNKQPLDFDFDTQQVTQGVRITNTQDVFSYSGTGKRRTVLFDRYGQPTWVMDEGAKTHRLTQAVVELTLNGVTRNVQLAPVSGRVTIQ